MKKSQKIKIIYAEKSAKVNMDNKSAGNKKIDKNVQELDRITKMLLRRDFELMDIREKQDGKIKELSRVKLELEQSKNVLEQKIEELEKMNKLMFGREIRMFELKKEIKQLKEK